MHACEFVRVYVFGVCVCGPYDVSPLSPELIKLKIQVPYSLDQMPQLLFILSINFVQPALKNSNYSKAALPFAQLIPLLT